MVSFSSLQGSIGFFHDLLNNASLLTVIMHNYIINGSLPRNTYEKCYSPILCSVSWSV